MTPAGRGPSDPWFHIGTLEVTTTMAAVLLTVASLVTWAVFPPSGGWLALNPAAVMDGEVWRVVTWPIAYPGGPGFWDVVSIFFLWYFGTDIENNLLGRVRMARMLVAMTLVLGLLWLGLAEALGFSIPLYTVNSLQLMVLLAWIAEWPTRRFLFNVPAWLFGVVIVGIYVLSYLGGRQGWLLLHFLLGILLCALVARHYGMLAEQRWLPALHLPQRHRTPKAPRSFKHGRPTVVSGPWENPALREPPVSRDEARMNALLDKIHAQGQDSLTDKERAELLELRDRLRRR